MVIAPFFLEKLEQADSLVEDANGQRSLDEKSPKAFRGPFRAIPERVHCVFGGHLLGVRRELRRRLWLLLGPRRVGLFFVLLKGNRMLYYEAGMNLVIGAFSAVSNMSLIRGLQRNRKYGKEEGKVSLSSSIG